MTGFVSKMIIDRENLQFLAFTRIFSGTIEANSVIKVIENNGNIIEAFIERLYILMG